EAAELLVTRVEDQRVVAEEGVGIHLRTHLDANAIVPGYNLPVTGAMDNGRGCVRWSIDASRMNTRVPHDRAHRLARLVVAEHGSEGDCAVERMQRERDGQRAASGVGV